MVRRFVLTVIAVAALGATFVVGAGASTGGVRATLTQTIHNGPAGTGVIVAWRLSDASGHAVLDRRVFVKITCPEGTDFTTTYANPGAHGVYVVRALVPPGGIGAVAIGHGNAVFPITNQWRAGQPAPS